MSIHLGTPRPRAIAGALRRTLPNSAAYALAAAVIGLSLVASVTPSPLYHTYSELWHFSPLTLTLIYATYAFGVLVTLLLAGRVSDDVGRRPVLLVALGVSGLQGLATGAALSVASAALLDLHPRRDHGPVGLTNGVAAASGGCPVARRT
jgi:MFS family permease